MGEERVQTLELLHRPNPMMGKPDLTPKAKGDQGRSHLLSHDLPRTRAFTSQIWPHPPSHLLLQSAREGNWDRDQEQMWGLCWLRAEGSVKEFLPLLHLLPMPDPFQTAEITV